MAEVLQLNGKPINWCKPPGPRQMVKWSRTDTGGDIVKGSFRHIAHINRLNNLCKKRFGVELQIIQPAYNTTVRASAGTHDKDCVIDCWIPGVDPWTQQRFFRRNGLGGWMRHPPLFGWHYHGFTLPNPEGKVRRDDFRTEVGIFVPGQLEDYYNHAFGLANAHTPGSDHSWFPKNIEGTVFKLSDYVQLRKKWQLAKIARNKKKKGRR